MVNFGSAATQKTLKALERGRTFYGTPSNVKRMRVSSKVYRKTASQKETNYIDLASASYNGDTTGSITLLNTVPSGSSQSERIGKKICLKGISFRGFLNNGSSATFNTPAWLIVYDRRPTGALPAITDILNTVNSNSFNNFANAGRFQILARRDYTLTGIPSTANGDSSAVSVKEYVNLKRRPTTYKLLGTGAIADISEGALYAITVGHVAAGTNACTFVGGYRLTYCDI